MNKFNPISKLKQWGVCPLSWVRGIKRLHMIGLITGLIMKMILILMIVMIIMIIDNNDKY